MAVEPADAQDSGYSLSGRASSPGREGSLVEVVDPADELGDFDIERTEVIGGNVAVTRAVEELLEPAHA